MRFKQLFCLMICTLTVVSTSSCLRAFVWCDPKEIKQVETTLSVPYKIFFDDMGTIIKVEVASGITEKQLLATLTKVAAAHQNDPARDYLFLSYLWIEAYLKRGGRRSRIPAGKLSRYIPTRDPAVSDEMISDSEKKDEFIMSINEAAKTLE